MRFIAVVEKETQACDGCDFYGQVYVQDSKEKYPYCILSKDLISKELKCKLIKVKNQESGLIMCNKEIVGRGRLKEKK